jgi:hypothetical protein
VIEALFLAEGDAGRIAAMFAADAKLEAIARRPAAPTGAQDQL